MTEKATDTTTVRTVFNQADAIRMLDTFKSTGPSEKQYESLKALMDQYLNALDLAAASGSADDLAVRMWIEANPDSEDAARVNKAGDVIAKLRAQIDEAKAKIAQINETVKAVKANAIEQFKTQAEVQIKVGSDQIRQDLKESASKLVPILGFINEIDTTNIVFPDTLAAAKSGSTSTRKASGATGGRRLRLESASVDGEPVVASGKYVNAGDIAKLIGSKPRPVTDAILAASNGSSEFAGLTLNINGKTIVVTSRN